MEEEGNEFLMETNRHCFICLQNLSREDGTIGSFQKVCAHLKINVPQVFKDTIRLSLKQLNLSDNMDKWELKGRFCPECATVAHEFKGLFAQLEKIQGKVDQCLSKVQRKFLEGNGNMKGFVADMGKHPTSLFHFAFVDTLRKEAIERCSLVLDKKPLPKALQSRLQKNHPRSPRRAAEPDIIEMKQELAPEPEVFNVEEIEPVPPILSPNVFSTPTRSQQPSTSAQARRQLQRQKVMNEVFNPEFKVDPATSYQEEGQAEEVELDGDPPVANTTPVQPPSNHGYGLRSTNKKLKRFQCQACPRTFKSLKEMEIHRRRLHAGMEFRCKMCPKAFPTSHGILCHTKKVHIKPEVQNSRRNNLSACDICQKTFKRRTYMLQHRKVHSGLKYQCSLCSKIFAHAASFYAHKREVHHFGKNRGNAEAKLIPVYEPPITAPPVVSPLRVMETPRVQLNRAPVVHEEEELGSFIFPMDGQDEGDPLGATPIVSPSKGKSGVFTCECGQSFKKSAGLKLHVYHKHPSKSVGPHQCDICDKRFSRLYSLKVHKDKAHYGGTYNCQNCTRTFSHPYSLNLHLRQGCERRQ